MRKVPYTVVEQDEIMELLNLDTAPTGLVILDADEDSCVVKTVPPQEENLPFDVPEYDQKVRGVNVSKKVLKEAWENGLIEVKSVTND